MADGQTLVQMVRTKYPGVYDDISDADLDSKVRTKFPGVYDDLAKPTHEPEHPAHQTSNAALKVKGATAAGNALPIVEGTLTEVATNPNVPAATAKIGRAIGGVAPIIGGAVEAGPVGALTGVAASSKGAWAGGKTGWFTGKLLQELSGYGAPVVEKVSQTLGPLIAAAEKIVGPQALLDLAQTADPHRKDIGFLGMSASGPTEMDALDAAVKQGINPAQAAAMVAKGDMQKYSKLITAYMKNRQVRP